MFFKKIEKFNNSFATKFTLIVLTYVMLIYIVATIIFSVFFVDRFENRILDNLETEFNKNAYSLESDIGKMYDIAARLAMDEEINSILNAQDKNILKAIDDDIYIQDKVEAFTLNMKVDVSIVTDNDNLYNMKYLSVENVDVYENKLDGKESNIYLSDDDRLKICLLKKVNINENGYYIKIENELDHYAREVFDDEFKYFVVFNPNDTNRYELVYKHNFEYVDSKVKEIVDGKHSLRYAVFDENEILFLGKMICVIDTGFLNRQRLIQYLYIIVVALLLMVAISFAVFYTVNIFLKKTEKVLVLSEDTETEEEFNKIKRRLEEILEENQKYSENMLKLEIENLQQKISPHFLFNNLSAISWNVEDERIEKIINLLTDYYRIVFYRNSEFIMLSEELNSIVKYIELLRFSYDKNFEFCTNIPLEIQSEEILSNIIQPIVENAFIHGVNRIKDDGGRIEINGTEKDGHIIISVINDGSRCDVQTMKNALSNNKNGKMSSLSIINKRIKMYYGDDCGIQFHTEETVTQIDIILRHRKE